MEIEGPFAEAREWLLDFMRREGIRNETLSMPLEADWSDYSVARSAYVLGVIWGRCRQMKNTLEQDVVYAELVNAELDGNG